MQDIWNKTWYPKAVDHVNTEKPWYVVDATDKILGRLASTIANHIRGKNLPTYTPSVDMGAFVIVVCGRTCNVMFYCGCNHYNIDCELCICFCLLTLNFIAICFQLVAYSLSPMN